MGLCGTVLLVIILVTTSSGFSLDVISRIKSLSSDVGSKVKNIVAPNEECFTYLGCFPMNSPWHTLMRLVPAPVSPEIINTAFYMYSRSLPAEGYNVTKLPEVSVEKSGFDNNKTTHFVIHGMTGSFQTVWIQEMKDALLTKYDCNVFVVDWSKGAASANYLQDVSNTRVAAAEVVRLLRHLIDKQGLKLTHLHLIGHSLGAHVASYVAKNITGVSRITALDPAQPAFEGYDPKVRLDKGDADLVVVIHTNARPFVPFFGLGMIQPTGHIDFYINGGYKQPGCETPSFREMLSDTSKPNSSMYDLFGTPYNAIKKQLPCSHKRACLIFTNSLLSSNCTFWGHKAQNTSELFSFRRSGSPNTDTRCTAETCVPLSMDAIYFPGRGVFDVPTLATKPFCINQPQDNQEMANLTLQISLNQSRIW